MIHNQVKLLLNILKGSLFVLPFLLPLVPLSAEDLPIARSEHGRYYTLIEVDGIGTYAFLMDSGASNTALYNRFTLTHDIEPNGFETRNILRASGRAIVQVYKVPKMTMGQISRDFKKVVALPDADDNRVMGIVGADFFYGHWVSLDPTKNVARIEPASIDVPQDWHKLQCKPVGVGSMSALVKVGELDVHAIIDTGATVSVLNDFAADALKLQPQKGRVWLGGGVKGGQETIVGVNARLPAMEIGPIKLPPQSVVVADLPAFIRFGAHRVPAMIMGMDIMKKFPILMNFDERCLYVKAVN